MFSNCRCTTSRKRTQLARRLLSLISATHKYLDPRVIEFITGLVLLAFGIALANPLVSTVKSTIGYTTLSQLSDGQDWPWAFIFSYVGFFQVCITKSLKWRKVSTIFTMGLFLFLAVASFTSNVAAFGPYLYSIFAAYAFLALRLMRDKNE